MLMDAQNKILERLAALEDQVRILQARIENETRTQPEDQSAESAERVHSTTFKPGAGRRDRLIEPLPPLPNRQDIRTRALPTKSTRASEPIRRFTPPGASFWMAGGAGIAFVLAAIYFIKIVYDFGWLTPERQIGLAAVAGIMLILGGLALARLDRSYAAYLPAAGVVILYVAIYSSHIFYGMISAGVVVFGVSATTVASMWLERHFKNSAYAVFAVIGAYAFPLLIRSASGSIVDEIIYFGAFSLLFSFISLQEKKRSIYTLAMFFSIIGFDIAWRTSADSEVWLAAALYQFIQFLVFAATATYYSIKFRSPVDWSEALWHGIALFYFYIAEYLIFKQNVPGLAPYVALISVIVVFSAFMLAARNIDDPKKIKSGATLISLYCAVVTAHVFFFELIPTEYLPWAALMAPITAVALRPRFVRYREAFIPIAFVAVFLSFVGLSMLFDSDGLQSEVFLPNVALFIYALFLYAGSRFSRLKGPGPAASVPLLYAGHIAFMVATIKTFDSGLIISIVWGVFAVVLLIAALRLKNRSLGQSSLLIFAASGLKVLLYDLTGTPSLVRVLTLVVLGATLYAGGWIYQRIAIDPTDDSDLSASAVASAEQ